MSALTTTPTSSAKANTRTAHWLFRLVAHFSGSAAATEQAYIERRHHDRYPDAAFHDAGLSRDDATGLGSHQGALAFFLQSDFGKH